ncbi:MAG: glycoside hydrolase family 2 TIM barrel-domain containing protein, partial [Candidatus Izemoplasmatales bacterium]|nr:glycoside hydrolase family 2 TIM barrel-domain containing protein [Candidatus Izemoplasmatales bacterium]
QLIDEIKDQIGFRSISFTANGFFLNGKKRKLIGLDRHQSYPYVGYAMPRRMQERDAEILRQDLGCHLVRTSHYMQSDHFIRRADEIGLLVLEEIPGWQYIGNNQFKELSLTNLKTMICHHFNHPSIVLWGVRINESPDDHAFYQETNRLAKELDSSRPTTGIRNFRHSEFLEDVYSYNDFSHVGDNAGLIHPNRVAGKHAPYLVTEHNGHIFPTKKTDPEKKLVEQAIRHLTVMDAAYRFDRVSGAIGWCLADYNTHKEFGSSDRVCYHGVMDMFRIPKIAAMAYASQHLNVPVLEIASSYTPGEYDESRLPELVIFTNCDSVSVRLNDKLIGTWYPDRKRFRHVPHPPIILPDLIGNRMETEEPYSKAKTRQILKVLRSYFRHGLRMPLADILRMAWLMLFRGFSTDEAYRLVGKYIINWGMDDVTYTFEGIRDNVKIITKTIGRSAERHLMMSVDDPILKPKDTYEVTRIVFRLEDGFGNICRNAYDVISVQVGEGLEIIGPKQVALIGGSTAVYVRTTRKKGIVPITCHMEGTTPKSIQITIQ